MFQLHSLVDLWINLQHRVSLDRKGKDLSTMGGRLSPLSWQGGREGWLIEWLMPLDCLQNAIDGRNEATQLRYIKPYKTIFKMTKLSHLNCCLRDFSPSTLWYTCISHLLRAQPAYTPRHPRPAKSLNSPNCHSASPEICTHRTFRAAQGMPHTVSCGGVGTHTNGTHQNRFYLMSD